MDACPSLFLARFLLAVCVLAVRVNAVGGRVLGGHAELSLSLQILMNDVVLWDRLLVFHHFCPKTVMTLVSRT